MNNIIYDWFDFVCILGFDFNIMLMGVWLLPQLPEKTHLYFSLGILLTSIYFTRRLIDFLIDKFSEKKGGAKNE